METGKFHLNNPILISVVGLLSNIPNKKGDFLIIIALMIISYIIYLVIKLHYSKADILQHWGKNRCNLGIIPIAGFIKPIGKEKYVGLKGSSENFKYCIDTISSSFVKVLLEPFMILANLVVDTYDEVFDLLNGLTDRLNGLRFNIFAMLLDYMKKLKYIGKALLYVNDKLDSIKEKTLIIIDNLIHFINGILNWFTIQAVEYVRILFQTIINTFRSLDALFALQAVSMVVSVLQNFEDAGELIGFSLELPFTFPPWIKALIRMIAGVVLTISNTLFATLLGTATYIIRLILSKFSLNEDIIIEMRKQLAEVDSASCFTNVNMVMNNGSIKNIKDIKPGEKLKNNVLVNGIINIKINAEMDIYKYGGVEVTGDHIVLHNGEWDRVANVHNNDCVNIRKYVDNLYCLITDNNIIEINGVTFRDYNEINDPVLQSYINYYVKKQVNEELRNPNKALSNNLVDYIDHTYTPCFTKSVYDNINYGDGNGNGKIGEIVILNTGKIKLYDYLGHTMSGNVLVLEDGEWIRVWESNNAQLVINDNKYLYHIITSNNEINIGQKNPIKIRDFSESNNHILNDKIDKMVINNLK